MSCIRTPSMRQSEKGRGLSKGVGRTCGGIGPEVFEGCLGHSSIEKRAS